MQKQPPTCFCIDFCLISTRFSNELLKPIIQELCNYLLIIIYILHPNDCLHLKNLKKSSFRSPPHFNPAGMAPRIKKPTKNHASASTTEDQKEKKEDSDLKSKKNVQHPSNGTKTNSGLFRQSNTSLRTQASD